jgi:hypothetical protein
MLQENWDWVLAVSYELRKKRVLTGDEIESLAIPNEFATMAQEETPHDEHCGTTCGH